MDQGSASIGAEFSGPAYGVFNALDAGEHREARARRRGEFAVLRELMAYAGRKGSLTAEDIKQYARKHGFVFPDIETTGGANDVPTKGSGNRGSQWGRDEKSEEECGKDYAVKRDPDIRGVRSGRRETDGTNKR